MDALNHLTWAGGDAISDGSYRPFNELLCLGYMEKQSIGVSFSDVSCSSILIDADNSQWHDDGEKDLGPDIASLSLGGAATMNFRLKSKHWMFKERVANNYNPHQQVLPGSQAWNARMNVNELYRAGQMPEYEEAKAQLFKSLNSKGETSKKNGFAVLSLELRHGDMVVMHGEDIQKHYEVCSSFYCSLDHIS